MSDVFASAGKKGVMLAVPWRLPFGRSRLLLFFIFIAISMIHLERS
jgi:hypothetical protein